MPRRRSDHQPYSDHEGSLFGDLSDAASGPSPLGNSGCVPAGVQGGAQPVSVDASVAQLGAALPDHLFMGTSSWTFPGWAGIVYRDHYPPRILAQGSGLWAYAQHPLFRTVGLDRAFYAVVSAGQYRQLAQVVPESFRFVIKAHQLVCRPGADEDGSTFGSTGEKLTWNPVFLDPLWAVDNVVGPAVQGLASRCGPIVFQLPPLDLKATGLVGGPEKLLEKLERFADGLAKAGATCALEVRNDVLLKGSLGAWYNKIVNLAHTIHGYCIHPTMPTFLEQARVVETSRAGTSQGDHFAHRAMLVRWLLRSDQTYEGAKDRYSPFNKIVDPDRATLQSTAGLVASALAKGRAAHVIVNNKAEGSAPLTVRRLAVEIQRVLQEQAPHDQKLSDQKP